MTAFQHHFNTAHGWVVVTRQDGRWSAAVEGDFIETRFSRRMWRWLEDRTSSDAVREMRKRVQK